MKVPRFCRFAHPRTHALCACLAFGCGSGTVERNEPVRGGIATAPGAVPSGPGGAIPSSQAALLEPGEAPEGSAVSRYGQLRIENARLVDSAGNPVQLEGVSSMWLNWESGYSQYADGLNWMRDNWNVELIRAAMGVEPNGAYLSNPAGATQELETVVKNAIAAGVYVIIDWHDHNAMDHQAEAVSFFTEMAEKWGAYPNVLYEVFNEPTPPNGTWPNIKPYHEATVAAIRAVDPDNIVILGTPNWSQYAHEAAADPVAGSNLMYTVHFYSCDHGSTIRANAQTAIDAGHAVFVTEWGATTADGGVPDSGARLCLDEAQAWHDWMATEGISWAAWKLDACADASCLFTSQAPLTGGWTTDMLQGHGPFVVDRLLD
jgi:endoglucanase